MYNYVFNIYVYYVLLTTKGAIILIILTRIRSDEKRSTSQKRLSYYTGVKLIW